VKYIYTQNDNIDTKWERKVVLLPTNPTEEDLTEEHLTVDIPPKHRPFPKLDDLCNFNSVTG
jgi:hypothetical protein